MNASRTSTPVAIVGGGPVGLALALGLSRHGVRSVLVERNASTAEQSRAPAIHVRTREVLRLWGVEERFLEAGVLRRSLSLYSPDPGTGPLGTVDFSDLEGEADRPGLLVLEQAHTERLLLEAVREAGLCEVRFGTEAVALEQGSDGARLTLRDAGGERWLDAAFVAGCDGAGSFVRDALELPFAGLTYSVRPMLADIRIRDERDALAWPRTYNGRGGLTTAIRLSPGLWRLIRLERGEPRQDEEVASPEVNERMVEVLGPGPFELVWASRFRIHRRASPRFRVDLLTRTFLDSPAFLRGAAFRALRLLFGSLRVRRISLRRTAMLDLDYPLSPILDGHDRAAGVRLPDPLLRGPDGAAVRLYDLLRNAPVMLAFNGGGDGGRVETDTGLGHSIAMGPGGFTDTSGLLRRHLGGDEGWMLIRPDAHIAWARRRPDGIRRAVSRALALPA